MQQGKNEEQLIQLAQQTGSPIPDKILNKPELLPGLEIYWKAFWACTRSRPIGMAEGMIPFETIDSWARRYQIWDVEFDRLLFLINAMDVVYMEERSRQYDKSMKQKSGGKIGDTKGPLKTKGK